MQRTIEQWRGCDPQAMATDQSPEARMFAHRDARADILELHGEHLMLADLLRECDSVLSTIEGESDEETYNLEGLRTAIAYALDPDKRKGTLL
jgi:hypothetical protein